MTEEFIAALKKLISDRGIGVLDDIKRCRALFLDYTKNTYKDEIEGFMNALEKFREKLQKSNNRDLDKKMLARNWRENGSKVDVVEAENTLNCLCHILFNEPLNLIPLETKFVDAKQDRRVNAYANLEELTNECTNQYYKLEEHKEEREHTESADTLTKMREPEQALFRLWSQSQQLTQELLGGRQQGGFGLQYQAAYEKGHARIKWIKENPGKPRAEFEIYWASQLGQNAIYDNIVKKEDNDTAMDWNNDFAMDCSLDARFRNEQGLCRHCDGKMHALFGIFIKKCKTCEKSYRTKEALDL